MKNALTTQVGMLGDMFFIACGKLKAMAIYLVKQACGNDIGMYEQRCMT